MGCRCAQRLPDNLCTAATVIASAERTQYVAEDGSNFLSGGLSTLPSPFAEHALVDEAPHGLRARSPRVWQAAVSSTEDFLSRMPSGPHLPGGVPVQLRAIRVSWQGPDHADMSVTARLQQGYPLFFQPLPELLPGMAETVEGTAGGHYQPGPYSCQEVRQERTVRAVVWCQQDVGLHVLSAGQQVAQGGPIGITGQKGQAVSVPDQAQDQGCAVALPGTGTRDWPGRMQDMQGEPLFGSAQLQDVSGMEGAAVPPL